MYIKEYLLKDAAKILKINYSTAKTIIRIFRLEKRMEKKAVIEQLDNMQNIENRQTEPQPEVSLDVDNTLTKIENELFTFGKVMDLVGNNISFNTDMINTLMKFIIEK